MSVVRTKTIADLTYCQALSYSVFLVRKSQRYDKASTNYMINLMWNEWRLVYLGFFFLANGHGIIMRRREKKSHQQVVIKEKSNCLVGYSSLVAAGSPSRIPYNNIMTFTWPLVGVSTSICNLLWYSWCPTTSIIKANRNYFNAEIISSHYFFWLEGIIKYRLNLLLSILFPFFSFIVEYLFYSISTTYVWGWLLAWPE